MFLKKLTILLSFEKTVWQMNKQAPRKSVKMVPWIYKPMMTSIKWSRFVKRLSVSFYIMNNDSSFKPFTSIFEHPEYFHIDGVLGFWGKVAGPLHRMR